MVIEGPAEAPLRNAEGRLIRALGRTPAQSHGMGSAATSQSSKQNQSVGSIRAALDSSSNGAPGIRVDDAMVTSQTDPRPALSPGSDCQGQPSRRRLRRGRRAWARRRSIRLWRGGSCFSISAFQALTAVRGGIVCRHAAAGRPPTDSDRLFGSARWRRPPTQARADR